MTWLSRNPLLRVIERMDHTIAPCSTPMCGAYVRMGWGWWLEALTFGGFVENPNVYDDDLYHLLITATEECERCGWYTDVDLAFASEEDFVEAREDAYFLAFQAYSKLVDALYAFGRSTVMGKEIAREAASE